MAKTPCVFCKKVHEWDREEAFQIMRKTPDTLRELLDVVDLKTLSRKSGDQWSPRELLIHLVDTEYVYGFRMRFIFAEEKPVITPVNQNHWVTTFGYGDQDATQLIRAFTPLRRVNLELLNTVDPALFEKPAHHPEFGTINVGMMVPHIAGHDLTHLQQIRDRIPAV